MLRRAGHRKECALTYWRADSARREQCMCSCHAKSPSGMIAGTETLDRAKLSSDRSHDLFDESIYRKGPLPHHSRRLLPCSLIAAGATLGVPDSPDQHIFPKKDSKSRQPRGFVLTDKSCRNKARMLEWQALDDRSGDKIIALLVKATCSKICYCSTTS